MLDDAGIYNFRRLGPQLTSSGQPTAEQLGHLRDAGVETVINLAMPDSPYAVAEEAAILAAADIHYIHIPVDFSAPGEDDFSAFCTAMDAAQGQTVHVHCIANYRVAAFMHRYGKSRPESGFEASPSDLPGDWQPDTVWQEFMNRD